MSLIGMILATPFILIIIIAIKFSSRGPILFKQKRVGKHRMTFNILKFRTMKIDTPSDTPTHLLNNPDQYITYIGKILRKSSMDELPQLWNIFVGDMSFIGPRPALWNQHDLIAEREKYGVNNIMPGLTGWAQINGRDELPIIIKAELDGEYVKNQNFKMDLKCFFGTIFIVLNGKGYLEGKGNLIVDKEIASSKENKSDLKSKSGGREFESR
ncbi:sugar transferase [Rossellomorea marisflavi]|nr:sugar transferase [Rossellomorea marisflavi]